MFWNVPPIGNAGFYSTAMKDTCHICVVTDDASLLLQKAFVVGIGSKVDTSSFICDALQLLNTETLA